MWSLTASDAATLPARARGLVDLRFVISRAAVTLLAMPDGATAAFASDAGCLPAHWERFVQAPPSLNCSTRPGPLRNKLDEWLRRVAGEPEGGRRRE